MKYLLTVGVLLASVAILPAQAMTPAAISGAADTGIASSVTQVRMDGDEGMHRRHRMHREMRRHMHHRMERRHRHTDMHHGDRM